jgi:hypothetical protein
MEIGDFKSQKPTREEEPPVPDTDHNGLACTGKFLYMFSAVNFHFIQQKEKLNHPLTHKGKKCDFKILQDLYSNIFSAAF